MHSIHGYNLNFLPNVEVNARGAMDCSTQSVNPFSSSDFSSYFVDKVESIQQSTADASKPILTSRSANALENFELVTVDEVMKLLNSVSAKQCALDPVPTWLVKQCADVLAPVITSMANISL